MKKLLFVLFLAPFFAWAQKPIKPVKMHTVGPKENLSSIGRMYEVNGRVLANYNNIDYDKGLTIGQVLKIPPKGTTLEQVTGVPAVKTEQPKTETPVAKTETKPTPAPVAETKTERGTPVYHKVAKKETLYHITTLYPGITIDDLKKWNNLTGDGVTEGASLIVGYKQGTKDTPRMPVEKDEKPATNEVVKKEPVKETREAVVPETKPSVPLSARSTKGGVFKSLFDEQAQGGVVSEEGSLGVFKSTSGWNDGKYFCLFNNANPGTILKISSPATGKFVYAKVLDQLPDLKQNNGLLVLISNAAADELGISGTTANCTVSFAR
ncbi:MAG TPA: LysM peptidoglycan-binding domain-containing protein [Ferruginibacter sp.]|nr:LysM peptidoglycan-binding domain-containing protein [Ferruginibacter sp.]